jgi:hypothetical protein
MARAKAGIPGGSLFRREVLSFRWFEVLIILGGAAVSIYGLYQTYVGIPGALAKACSPGAVYCSVPTGYPQIGPFYIELGATIIGLELILHLFNSLLDRHL